MVRCNICKKKVEFDEIMRDGSCIDCIVRGLDYGQDDIDDLNFQMGIEKDLFSVTGINERTTKMGNILKWVFG